MKRYYDKEEIEHGWLLYSDGSYVLQSLDHQLPTISSGPQVLKLAKKYGTRHQFAYGNPNEGRVQCWDPSCTENELVEAPVFKYLPSNGLYAPTGKYYSAPAPSEKMVFKASRAKKSFFAWREVHGEHFKLL